jgi:hypothetical protein
MKKKTSSHGGKRKGAGRKATGKVFFRQRVHPEHVVAIKAFIDTLPPPSGDTPAPSQSCISSR